MKTRVLSAIALIAFFAAVLVFNQSFPYALQIAIAGVSMLAIYEIFSAMGLTMNLWLFLPSLAIAAAMPLMVTDYDTLPLLYVYTLYIFTLLILKHKTIDFKQIAVIYSMVLLIPEALSTIVRLRAFGGNYGLFYVTVCLLAAWAADTGAYFAGSFLGKHKLCPEISPKKTIEGAIGGSIVNILAMVLCGVVFKSFFAPAGVEVSYLSLVLIGLICSVVSIIGDLSFSLIKRGCHIKDFGNVLPGHGGILDRFDSVVFVAPLVFYFAQYSPLIYTI